MTQNKEIFLPLYNDIIFTEIFNNPDNIEILENFLENYFNYKLGSLRNRVVLKHRYLSIFNKKEARKQVDILIELDDKTSINLEMNNSKRKDIFIRNRIYASKIHGQKLKKNTRDYNAIGTTIQINLNTKLKNSKELIERWYITNEVTKEKVNDIEIDMVDLQKEKLYNESGFGKWCKLILAESMEEFKEILKEVPMKKSLKDKLRENLERLNADEECIALYSNYTQAELEYNTMLNAEKREAEAKGLKKGEVQGKKEDAKAMLQENMNVEFISRITKLPIREIEMLR